MVHKQTLRVTEIHIHNSANWQTILHARYMEHSYHNDWEKPREKHILEAIFVFADHGILQNTTYIQV